MKPLALNLSKMKKVGGDAHQSVFQHPDGHTITVAHKPLKALQRKQIENMPVHKYADGGETIPVSLSPQIPDSLASKDSGSQNDIDYSKADYKNEPTPEDAPYGSGPSELSPGPSPASIPVQAQAVSAPEQVSKTQDISSMYGGDLESAYQQGLKGIQEQQKVSSQMAAQSAEDYKKDSDQRQALIDDAKNNLDLYQTHANELMNDYSNNYINPNAYLENMSVPGKISTAIGLLLGGAGAHSSGGVNQAVQFLNQQIERNIAAQQNRQDQTKTLMGANRQLYGDQLLAQNQTRINMNDMTAHKIQMEGAKLGTPQAQAAADQAASQFKMQNIPLLQQNAIRTTVLKNLQSSGGRGVSALDLAHAGFMSPEEATKEQASVDAQNAGISQVKSLYSKLGQTQTLGNRISNPIQSGKNVDALNAEITNAVMGADVSKRLTPESAKLEVLPFHVGLSDSQETVNHKMAGVLDLIKQHNAGLTPNMNRYAPASLPNYSSAMPNPLEGKTASDSKGNRIIMKNGSWVPYGG